MEISVNETEYCKLTIHYEEDPNIIGDKREEVLNKFKGAKVSGFRPGKAPLDAVKMQYRKEVEEELKKVLAEDAYYNVVAEKHIKPFGQPIFTAINLETFKFSCDFVLHQKPDFELGQYKDIEVPKPHLQISTQELTQKTLEELRHKYGEETPFIDTDFIEMNDSVILDYNAFGEDGQLIEAITGHGELLTVGTTPFGEFDSNLLGMKSGEERTFTVVAPIHENSPMSGQKIKFDVKIITGSKKQPVALSDELAKQVGLSSLQELQANVETLSTERVQQLMDKEITHQLIKQIVMSHNIKVPTWLAAPEAKVVARELGSEWDASTDEQKEGFMQTAENNIKITLILDKVREKEPEAQLSDEEAFNVLKANLPKVESMAPDAVLQNLANTGYMPMMMNRIKDEYALNFLVKNTKVIE